MVLRRKYLTQDHPDGCWFGCSMACAKAVDGFEVKTGPYKGQRVTVDGPEYETVELMGADCGIDDLAPITKANYLCNELGMDTISAACTVATAMELYEKGKIPKKDAGMDLRFGNGGNRCGRWKRGSWKDLRGGQVGTLHRQR